MTQSIKKYQKGYVQRHSQQLQQITTIRMAFKSDLPKLSTLKEKLGEPATIEEISTAIFMFQDIYFAEKKHMTDTQVQFLASQILIKYPYFHISELKLLFERIGKGKVFGTLDPNHVMHELNGYMDDRCIEAEKLSLEHHIEHKNAEKQYKSEFDTNNEKANKILEDIKQRFTRKDKPKPIDNTPKASNPITSPLRKFIEDVGFYVIGTEKDQEWIKQKFEISDKSAEALFNYFSRFQDSRSMPYYTSLESAKNKTELTELQKIVCKNEGWDYSVVSKSENELLYEKAVRDMEGM